MPNAGALGGLTAIYVNDNQIQLAYNTAGSTAERVYFSQWNQVTNEWGGEFYSAQPGGTSGNFSYYHTDTIVANRKYRFRARGWRSDGPSGFGPYTYSDYIQTTPAAPTGAAVSSSGPNAMSVSWQNNATLPFYDYRTLVYYSENGGGWVECRNLDPGVTSTYLPDLNAGSTYKFGVQAYDSHNPNNFGYQDPQLYSTMDGTATLTATNTPTPPTNVVATRSSDTQASITFTNNASAQAPYNQVHVDRWDSIGQTWTNIANLAYNATSLTDTSIVPGRRYQWRFYASNGVGVSGYTHSGDVFTTPLAPSGVTAQYVGGTSIKVAWTNPSSYTEYTLKVQRYLNGVADGGITTLISGATEVTQATVAGNTYFWRVWAVSGAGSLASTETQSNSVVPASMPNAPTGLASSAAYIDVTKLHTFSWKHSPTDGSLQTKRQLRYRLAGATLWAEGAEVAGNVQSIDNALALVGFTNGQTVELAVRTWGIHATPGPYSATLSQQTSASPTVTVTGPPSPIVNSSVTAAWTYAQAQGSAQAEWAAEVYNANSGTLEATATGLTNATSHQFAGFAAVDGQSYRIDVRVRSAVGLWSQTASRTIQATFTPPAIPLLAASLDEPTGAALLSLTPTAPVTPGSTAATNLITNPSFEVNTTGWGQYINGTLSRSTTVAFAGTASLAVTANANGAASCHTSAMAAPVTAGQTYTASVYVRSATVSRNVVLSIMWNNSSGTHMATSQSASVATATNGWVRISVTGVAPTGAASAWLLPDSLANLAGEVTYYDGVMLVQSSAIDYFDGSTARDTAHYYEWSGTANASTSVKKRIGTLTAVSASVERRFWDYEIEAFGEWETLIAEAPLDAVLVDPTAPMHDDGEYRVIAHSIAPSIGRPNFTVKPPKVDNRWLYVSGGPQFDVVCKMWANIEIEQTASRNRALHYFAGRKNPVIYTGDIAERTYSVSGILEDEATDPNQWMRLARQSGPVLLRAPGRRMFGSLSEVSISRIQNGLHKVSFSIQEVAT